MGQGLGQAQNPEVSASYFSIKNKEKVLKSCDFRTFMVAETGLEPATSGLWAAVEPSNPCGAVLSGAFCSEFWGNPEVEKPIPSTVSMRSFRGLGQGLGQHLGRSLGQNRTLAWSCEDAVFSRANNCCDDILGV